MGMAALRKLRKAKPLDNLSTRNIEPCASARLTAVERGDAKVAFVVDKRLVVSM
jgi:hypothetical protein